MCIPHSVYEFKFILRLHYIRNKGCVRLHWPYRKLNSSSVSFKNKKKILSSVKISTCLPNIMCNRQIFRACWLTAKERFIVIGEFFLSTANPCVCNASCDESSTTRLCVRINLEFGFLRHIVWNILVHSIASSLFKDFSRCETSCQVCPTTNFLTKSRIFQR